MELQEGFVKTGEITASKLLVVMTLRRGVTRP